MIVNKVELLPLEKLRPNPENPKAPLGLTYKRGLRASLERFGFAGVFVVAANEDGTYEVLDGNTRIDELEKAGVETVPCVVYRGMSRDDRRAFALAHDRNRKKFDEAAVLSQLEALSANGEDVRALATLAAKPNLERLLAESQGSARPAAATSGPSAPAMASLVLYGPAGEMTAIKDLLKRTKGKLSTLEKARKALSQADDFLDWEDERLLALLLATLAKFNPAEEIEEPHEGPQTETDAPENPERQPPAAGRAGNRGGNAPAARRPARKRA